MPFQHFAGDVLLLPFGKIAVLDLQFGERTYFSAGECLIESGNLSNQNTHRPAIGDDVVHGQQNDMVFATCPQQGHAEQGSLGEIERLTGFFIGQAQDFLLTLFNRKTLQVDFRHRQRPTGTDNLNGLSVHGGESGAQGLVPANDFIDAILQSLNIQRTFEANRRRDIIKRTIRLELIQEPQPLLSKGSGKNIYLFLFLVLLLVLLLNRRARQACF